LKGYNKNRIKAEFPWKRFLVVRPDRYTFGTAQTVDGVQDIARRAKALILRSNSHKVQKWHKDVVTTYM
jgi:hypothetical protein